MQVTNIVIHEFIKDKKGTPVTEYALRKTENPINKISSELIETLHKNYSSKENTVQQGKFKELDTGGSGNFSKYFIAANSLESAAENKILTTLKDKCKDLYPEGCTSGGSDFYNLSIYFMEGLKEFGNNSNIIGGLLLFAKYMEGEQSFFIVVMLDKLNAYDINELDIEKTEMVSIDKLRQALRVNASRFSEEMKAKENDDDTEKKLSYLSFINSGRAEVREFFINTSGCEKQLSNTKATDEVYKFVENIILQYENLKSHQWDIKDSITDYLSDRLDNHAGKINRTSLIEHISQHAATFCPDEDVMDDNNESIIKISKESLLNIMLETANSDNFNIPVNFKAVKSIVEKNKRYVKRFNGTYLKIDFNDIGTSPDDLLYWDDDTETLRINDSEIKNKMINKDS